VKEKKEAYRALLRVPLAFAPSEVKQESPGFAEFGLPGVPNLMRAQRAASALIPLCAEGDGLRGRWSTESRWGEGMHFTALKEKDKEVRRHSEGDRDEGIQMRNAHRVDLTTPREACQCEGRSPESRAAPLRIGHPYIRLV